HSQAIIPLFRTLLECFFQKCSQLCHHLLHNVLSALKPKAYQCHGRFWEQPDNFVIPEKMTPVSSAILEEAFHPPRYLLESPCIATN
ncbi:hypothetical protein SK128_014629, partial [Halocaridina rubra]